MSGEHYQHGYGVRPLSNWGLGDEQSRFAEGDVVEIPLDSLARKDGRIPHGWSLHPELWDGVTRFRVVTCFSIDEDASYYYRVSPIADGRTLWDEHSDRLHSFVDGPDYCADWTLVRAAKSSEPPDRALSGGEE